MSRGIRIGRYGFASDKRALAIEEVASGEVVTALGHPWRRARPMKRRLLILNTLDKLVRHAGPTGFAAVTDESRPFFAA